MWSFWGAWGSCNPHSWVVHPVLQLDESWAKVDGNGEHVLLQDIRNYMAGQMPPEFLENRMEHFFSDLENHLGNRNPLQSSSLKLILLCIFHAKIMPPFSCWFSMDWRMVFHAWIGLSPPCPSCPGLRSTWSGRPSFAENLETQALGILVTKDHCT